MFLRENIDDCVVCNNTLIALLMTPKNFCTNAVLLQGEQHTAKHVLDSARS